MELLTPLETLCRLILRARELEAQVPADDPDEDPDNVDDLTTRAARRCRCSRTSSTTASRRRCRRMLDDLADDQLAETLALAWVGRGTYDASEWDEAFAEASDLDADERIDELLDMPLLAGHLEAGPRRVRL